MNNDKKVNTGFELTLEQIDLMDKTADYLREIADFSGWCTANVENIDLKNTIIFKIL
jgi:hypothetical protein